MRSKSGQTDEVENTLHVNFHWTKFIPVLLVIAGLGQFVFGISAAVSHYPSRFSFQRDFLSELGQTRLSNYSSNGTSCAIFNGTVVLLGMSLIPMFLTVKDHSGDADHLSRGLGVASSVALVGIGITPFDRVEELHLFALGCWLLSLAGMAVMRILRACEAGATAAWSGFISFGLILAIGCYVMTMTNRSAAPLGQKIAIVAAMFWGLDLVREVSKYTMEVIVLRRTHHRAVEDYLARLNSQPLYRATPPDYQRHRSSIR
jgi:hypothetical membrane protein